MKWRRASAGILLCILLFLFSGCLNSPEGTVRDTSDTASWRSITLRDITTGENFTLDSLGSTPVILFTFTVACPICTRQQQEITQFKREMGERVAVVGLDIDPNEDEKTLHTHIERYRFLGYYARSPPGMTQSLVDRFGPLVVTPASAPVIVICPGGGARLLDSGIKPAAFLSASLGETC